MNHSSIGTIIVCTFDLDNDSKSKWWDEGKKKDRNHIGLDTLLMTSSSIDHHCPRQSLLRPDEQQNELNNAEL